MLRRSRILLQDRCKRHHRRLHLRCSCRLRCLGNLRLQSCRKRRLHLSLRGSFHCSRILLPHRGKNRLRLLRLHCSCMLHCLGNLRLQIHHTHRPGLYLRGSFRRSCILLQHRSMSRLLYWRLRCSCMPQRLYIHLRYRCNFRRHTVLGCRS